MKEEQYKNQFDINFACEGEEGGGGGEGEGEGERDGRQ